MYVMVIAHRVGCWGVSGQASVGRLGIITRLKVPHPAADGGAANRHDVIDWRVCAGDHGGPGELQGCAGARGSQAAVREALQPLDNVQVCDTSGQQPESVEAECSRCWAP